MTRETWEHEAATSSSADEKRTPPSRSGGALAGLGKALNVATGASYYKRNVKYVAERAKFPLLRRVISNDYKSQRQLVDLAMLQIRFVEKTLFWQRVLFTMYLLAGVYALMSISRGLAAGIRYDMWFTHWLYMGVGLLCFSVARGLISFKVIRDCAAELRVRKDLIKDAASGGHDE